MINTTTLAFIIYDGITNSVFASQVLQPLLNIKQENPDQKIVLISFEKKKQSLKNISAIEQQDINLIISKKYPFIGVKTLSYAITLLRKVLTDIPRYQIIARGPQAGWLALHAANPHHCKAITIQARGLLAQEYAYVHQNTKNRFIKRLHHWRKNQYAYLEKVLYSSSIAELTTIPITFEAVSPALKEYLIKQYDTDPRIITIAKKDIPQPIDPAQQKQWRTAIRTQLGLSQNPHIYCYNGSVKSWQCPETVIEFFAEELKKDDNCFLLILTQDKKQFEKLLKQYQIDPARFYVCTIAHDKIYQYLAACDSGLLFREKNSINWVSRPTKVLEYQAAGLNIIHNNTVAYLRSFDSSQQQPRNHR